MIPHDNTGFRARVRDIHLPSLERLEALARTIVRPAVTLILVVVASWMVMGAKPIPDWYMGLVISLTSYWFGSRSNGAPR